MVTTEELLAIIQPYLIPENRVNPNTPLCKSFGGACDIYIYRLPNTNPSVLVFESSGAVDCDGQRTNICNENTDDGYQPQTSFEQSNGLPLDASTLPFYVLPDHGNYFNYANNNIQGGQLGLVMYSDKMNYGVFGDENADTRKSGEVSYAMASSLGFDPDPTTGGVAFGVWYIIFTGTENVVSPIEDHSKAVTMGNTALNTMLSQIGVPIPTTGSLSVSSTPTGAMIFIDGSDTTYVTNALISGIPSGVHVLKLTKSGYNDYTKDITIVAGQTTTEDITLIPITPPPPPPPPSPPPANLVGYWNFDETSGDIAFDSSGNNNDGNKHNTTIVASKYGFGNALSFNGLNSYVDIGAKPIFNITSEITIMAWIKTTSSKDNIIISRGLNGRSYHVWSLTIEDGYGTLYWADGYRFRSRNIVSGNTKINDGEWHHIVGRVTSSKIEIIIDGIVDASKNKRGNPKSNNSLKVLIGNMHGYNEYYDGIIDEVKIYNKAIPLETTTGNLSVSSTPSGAEIFIDGTDKNEITPSIIQGITTGDHILKLTKIGYNDYTKNIVILDGQTTTENPTLIPITPVPTGDTIKVYITDPNSLDYNKVVTLDLETEYLPYVVASENGSAPLESMKAQAIASRTFAYYKKITSPRSTIFDVYDDGRDQVYHPYLNLDYYPNVRQSVIDTKVIVIKWGYQSNFNYLAGCIPPTSINKIIICSFYISGSGSYSQYVTYNEGKSGECITQSSIGWVSNPSSLNPYNRGAMGQIQANALASNNGYTQDRILRYFYGEDIIIEPK